MWMVKYIVAAREPSSFAQDHHEDEYHFCYANVLNVYHLCAAAGEAVHDLCTLPIFFFFVKKKG